MTREARLADEYYAKQEVRLAGESAPETPEIVPKIGIDSGLDPAEVLNLIREHDGNVTLIAHALHVRSDRVRKFIEAKRELKEAMAEVYEGAVDEAIGVLFAGLRDEHSFQNRFYAAKEFIKSEAGRKRGFGKDPGLAAQIELKTDGAGGGRTITLKWIDPDAPPPPKVIDGDPV